MILSYAVQTCIFSKSVFIITPLYDFLPVMNQNHNANQAQFSPRWRKAALFKWEVGSCCESEPIRSKLFDWCTCSSSQTADPFVM